MLKKSAAILLILLYMGTVSGFALNLHYCFGRLTSVKIDAPAKLCAKGIVTSKMKCCRDKHIQIKVKDAHEAGSGSIISKIFNEDLPFMLFGNILFNIPEKYAAAVSYHAPPVVLSPATIFLTNCTFRI